MEPSPHAITNQVQIQTINEEVLVLIIDPNNVKSRSHNTNHSHNHATTPQPHDNNNNNNKRRSSASSTTSYQETASVAAQPLLGY
jgi:hypothetical protein